MRTSDPLPPAALSKMNWPEAAQLRVSIEGRLQRLNENEGAVALPSLGPFTNDVRFIDVFNAGRSPAPWIAKTNYKWIKLSQAEGNLREDTRIRVSIDWANAPQGENVSGIINISAAGATRRVNVPIFNPPIFNPRNAGRSKPAGFVESNGAMAIEAEHFTTKTDRASAGWQVIPGLGRTGDSVAIFPTTAAAVNEERVIDEAPKLEYQLNLLQPCKITITYYVVPTHPLTSAEGLRFAAGVDDQTPQLITIDKGLVVPSPAWFQNVLNATTTGASTHQVNTAGAHVLKIYMIDAGVVLDKIVVDTGGVRPSYLGPKETKVVASAARR